MSKWKRDSERQAEKWIWMSKWECGSERQAENEQRLWTPNDKGDLDVELEANNDYKCQTKDTTQNIKLKMRLWTLSWRCGSKRQTEIAALNAKTKETWLWYRNENANNGSEHQTEDMALNAKLKMWLWMPNWRCGFERQTKIAVLNAKTKETWLWYPNENANNGSEHQSEDAALNAKPEKMYDGYEYRAETKLWL